MRNFPWLVVVVVVATFFAQDALACTVCFDPKEERRMAFMVTTVLLTFLPLGLIFGTIYFLRKHISKQEPVPPAE